MRASRLLALVASIAGIMAHPAPAQISPSLEARAQLSSGAGGEPWHGTSVLGGNLRFDRPWLSLSGTGELHADDDRWLGSAGIAGALRTPALGPFQLSLSGDLHRPHRPDADQHYQFTGTARASLRRGEWGVWAGIDGRRIMHRASSSPSLGGWRQLGAALLSVQLAPRRAQVTGTDVRIVPRRDSMFNDTLGRWEVFERTDGVVDSSRVPTAGSWSDAEARLLWARGRISLDATIGGRFAAEHVERSLWAQLRGLYTISSRFAIIAGAGSEPADPVAGWERRSFATLGVRVLDAPAPRMLPAPGVRPVPAEFQLLPGRADAYLIRVRVPHAHSVELSADFTDWRPIALTRASTDWWQASATIAPGTYHVNIRVNGDRWTAPPGTPAIEDEFNGTVGLVVVP
jgi:hypothetical protein